MKNEKHYPPNGSYGMVIENGLTWSLKNCYLQAFVDDITYIYYPPNELFNYGRLAFDNGDFHFLNGRFNNLVEAEIAALNHNEELWK